MSMDEPQEIASPEAEAKQVFGVSVNVKALDRCQSVFGSIVATIVFPELVHDMRKIGWEVVGIVPDDPENPEPTYLRVVFGTYRKRYAKHKGSGV